MRISIKIVAALLMVTTSINAQTDTIKLKEVSVTSNRIVLPFSKTSRTITIITSQDILRNPASNLADLLQNVSGIDIRRRGTDRCGRNHSPGRCRDC